MQIVNASGYKILHFGAKLQKYQTLAKTVIVTLRYQRVENQLQDEQQPLNVHIRGTASKIVTLRYLNYHTAGNCLGEISTP